MKRLGIVIGISEYQNLPALPACQNDVQLVHECLHFLGSFDEILLIDSSNSKSSQAKKAITDFIAKHKSSKVDEFVVYYSGHGTVEGDEFLYLFADYDPARPSQTSLTNSELDSYLRAIGPTITAKIVDACHAGVQYIKDAAGMQTLLAKGVKGVFSKVYFLFSSSINQSSFCDSSLSDFTKSVVQGVIKAPNDKVRYQDVIDYVTDDFRNNPSQKPFFVIQADQTEVLADLNPDTRKKINDAYQRAGVNVGQTSTAEIAPANDKSLVALVKRQSQEYFSDDAIVDVLELVHKQVDGHKPPAEIDDLFERKITFESTYDKLPRKSEIGQWLSENRSRNLFADVKTELKERYVFPVAAAGVTYPTFNPLSAAGIVNSGAAVEPKKEWTNEIIGFELEFQKAPFRRIRVGLLSRFVNVPSFTLNIVFLFSRVELVMFLHIAESWAKGMPPTTKEQLPGWRSETFRLANVRDNPVVVGTFLDDAYKFLIARLEQIVQPQK